jgi:hypothetical protein
MPCLYISISQNFTNNGLYTIDIVNEYYGPYIFYGLCVGSAVLAWILFIVKVSRWLFAETWCWVGCKHHLTGDRSATINWEKKRASSTFAFTPLCLQGYIEPWAFAKLFLRLFFGKEVARKFKVAPRAFCCDLLQCRSKPPDVSSCCSPRFPLSMYVDYSYDIAMVAWYFMVVVRSSRMPYRRISQRGKRSGDSTRPQHAVKIFKPSLVKLAQMILMHHLSVVLTCRAIRIVRLWADHSWQTLRSTRYSQIGMDR